MARVLLDRHGRVRGYGMGLAAFLVSRCLTVLVLAGVPFILVHGWWLWLACPVWAALLGLWLIGSITAAGDHRG